MDNTPEYIADARRTAQAEGLAVEFIQADVREVASATSSTSRSTWPTGPSAYFESDAENLACSM